MSQTQNRLTGSPTETSHDADARTPRRGVRHGLTMLAAVGALALGGVASGLSLLNAQTEHSGPWAELMPATLIDPPGETDSNSPAVWSTEDGAPTLHVFNSYWAGPSVARGAGLEALGAAEFVTFTPRPTYNFWIETVIPEADGTWYGYYHYEVPAADACGDAQRMLPRIGAARSTDRGATWEDLGVILEAPAGSHDCDSPNMYFVGGVGDFSAVLNHSRSILYIYYSQYTSDVTRQGVAVARLSWADRDAPAGRVAVWNAGRWVRPRRAGTDLQTGRTMWHYPSGTPIFAATDSWHDSGTTVDAFWGPSIHWNTYLRQWVMLLNRASDVGWRQEGIYASFSPRLDSYQQWSRPQQVMSGGGWYPHVMGMQVGSGTDRLAGRTARFFTGGRSEHLIRFHR